MRKKAKESAAIAKARKKLKQRTEQDEKKITEAAIHAVRVKIEKQLMRHQAERIDLKDKRIALFDENQHPAKTKSVFIAHLLEQLKHPLKQDQEPLKKRIIHHS